MDILERLNERGLMRGAMVGSKSRYLSMALASRKLMTRLDSYAQTGQLGEPVVQALTDLLRIMDSNWQTNNTFAPLPGQSPFSRYEQAQIVIEVAGPFNSRDVRGKLGQIVDGTVLDQERDPVVRDINDFLYDLENRSLYKYSEESSSREW